MILNQKFSLPEFISFLAGHDCHSCPIDLAKTHDFCFEHEGEVWTFTYNHTKQEITCTLIEDAKKSKTRDPLPIQHIMPDKFGLYVDLPDKMYGMCEEHRKNVHRDEQGTMYVIKHKTGADVFFQVNLEIPIRDSRRKFVISTWALTDEKIYKRMLIDGIPEGGFSYHAKLANEIPFYSNSINDTIEVTNYRHPKQSTFEPLSAKTQMYKDFENGISMRDAYEIWQWISENK